MQWPKKAVSSSSPKGGAAKPGRKTVLALRPLRNPDLEWYEEDGHVVLHVKRAVTWKTKLLNVFFPLPSEHRVVLDAIGTDVWQMMDGQTTVGRIARSLDEKYKLGQLQAELALQHFFKELGRRGYVGFWMEEGKATPEPPAPQTGQRRKKRK